jgi:hypothetical protein
MDVERRCVKVCHRFGDRAAQRLALAEQQPVDGFSCQRVTEGELLVRFFHDELRGK